MATNYDWIINLHQHEKKSITVMNNLEIIIFSVVVSISFIVFIVTTIMEFNKMSNSQYQTENKTKTRVN